MAKASELFHSYNLLQYNILDLVLYPWQSADILDPLFKLGVGNSKNVQIFRVIEKYLRIIEFRLINTKSPSN